MQQIAFTSAEYSLAFAGRGDPDQERTPDIESRGLSLTGLRKSFGNNPVLRGIDLHILAGHFVAFVGRSGCGKSTLLRLIAGLEKPSGGSVQLGDQGADAKRDIRLMFQEPRLLPWVRVRTNVEVGLPHVAKPEAERRADEALRDVGLVSKREQWPATLSGGQKQRVALARALVSHPRILALDEPLSALDALTRISMQSLLERVWRDLGFTAIFVTHDVSEAVLWPIAFSSSIGDESSRTSRWRPRALGIAARVTWLRWRALSCADC